MWRNGGVAVPESDCACAAAASVPRPARRDPPANGCDRRDAGASDGPAATATACGHAARASDGDRRRAARANACDRRGGEKGSGDA
jgi:hypothetical protein